MQVPLELVPLAQVAQRHAVSSTRLTDHDGGDTMASMDAEDEGIRHASNPP